MKTSRLHTFTATSAFILLFNMSNALAIDITTSSSDAVNGMVSSGSASVSEQSVMTNDNGTDEQDVVNDPWEGYNRRMYNFNNGFDKVITRPLAIAYEAVTPEPVQACISRFFGNLREPGTAVNQVLQGKPLSGMRTAGRFAINTTVGIAGLYDPATFFGISRGYEDFGQTLALWGWQDSRYFVVPLFGPRTLRDTAGIVGDFPLSPIGYVQNDTVALGLNIMQLTDARAQVLPFDEMRRQAIDEYTMVRNAWMAKRANQISKD